MSQCLIHQAGSATVRIHCITGAPMRFNALFIRQVVQHNKERKKVKITWSQCLIHQAGSATVLDKRTGDFQASQCLIHQAGSATPVNVFFS